MNKIRSNAVRPLRAPNKFDIAPVMSNPTTSPSEQPAIEAAQIPDASAQQVSNDHTATIESLPAEQLLKLLNGEEIEAPVPVVSRAPTATPEEVIPEAEPAEATPTGEQPDGDASIPGEGKTKQRVSIRFLPADAQAETSKALELVRLGEAPDLLTALQSLRGTASPAASPTAEPVETAAIVSATPSPDVLTIEATIADLSAQRDQAEDDYDKPRTRELDAQIRQQERLLIKAELIAEQQQQSVAVYHANYDKAVDILEERYPDVLDGNSRFCKYLNAMVHAAKADNDPRLAKPDYLLDFAAELDADLNPKAKPATPIPAVPPTATRMGTTVAPSSAAAPRATPADTEALIKSASSEDLLAVLATH